MGSSDLAALARGQRHSGAWAGGPPQHCLHQGIHARRIEQYMPTKIREFSTDPDEHPQRQPRSVRKSAERPKSKGGENWRLARRGRIACPWSTDADHLTVRGWCQLEILSEQVYSVLLYTGITSDGITPRRC